jgi:hypothetical protein
VPPACRESRPRWPADISIFSADFDRHLRVPSLIVVGDHAMMRLVLLRVAYLGTTNAFALLRLLPGSDRD